MADVGFITAIAAIFIGVSSLVLAFGGILGGHGEPLEAGGGSIALTALYLATAWFVSVPVETVLFLVYLAGIVYLMVRFNPAPATRER